MKSSAVAALVVVAGRALAGPVIVSLDMDPARPGIQSVVYVPPGASVVPIAVYIYDPEGTRSLQSIGYVGALDRGVSLGHIPRAGNQGQVTSLTPLAGTPVNPSNTGSAFPAQDPGFAGAEVQYIEYNAAAPALIAATPANPVFRVDVHLSGAASGDVFPFAVMDFVSVWRGGTGGAFTTGPGRFLDTGGDVTPDGTQGLFAVDPDHPVPVPPGAFEVDYIDGGNQPARIIVGGCYANCDGSTAPPVLNVGDYVCFINAFAAGDLYANCDGSTTPPRLNVNDFVCFASQFAAGCP